MKSTVLFFLLLLFFPAIIVFSDDGSWRAAYSLAEGSLYIEGENPDIVLEKEVLTFEGFDSGRTEAVFQFRNTSQRAVRIEAGFPVKAGVDLSAEYKPGRYYLLKQKYGPAGKSAKLAEAAFGNRLQKDTDLPEDDFLGISPYYITKDDLTGRNKTDAASFPDLFHFSITQDGKPVDWDFVVTETRPEEGEYDYRAEIVFHFHHYLQIGPSGTSEVKITYTEDTLTGEDNTGFAMVEVYEWNYILGTGATWKQPIGKLYLILPSDIKVDLPPELKSVGNYRGRTLYKAVSYEPAGDAELYARFTTGPISPFMLEYIWFQDETVVNPPEKPAQDFVKVKGASSYLPDKVTLYTPQGVMKNAGFGPEALFDGVRESAWCEGVKGDGIGEHVDFTLLENVYGLSIQNGFNMSFTEIEGKSIHTYYEKNNRVKTLRISSADGKINRTLQLKDKKDVQVFPDIILPKGDYSVTVMDVYKGTKWQDTLLGEITFVPADGAVIAEVDSDSFLADHF